MGRLQRRSWQRRWASPKNAFSLGSRSSLNTVMCTSPGRQQGKTAQRFDKKRKHQKENHAPWWDFRWPGLVYIKLHSETGPSIKLLCKPRAAATARRSEQNGLMTKLNLRAVSCPQHRAAIVTTAARSTNGWQVTSGKLKRRAVQPCSWGSEPYTGCLRVRKTYNVFSCSGSNCIRFFHRDEWHIDSVACLANNRNICCKISTLMSVPGVDGLHKQFATKWVRFDQNQQAPYRRYDQSPSTSPSTAEECRQLRKKRSGQKRRTGVSHTHGNALSSPGRPATDSPRRSHGQRRNV